MITFCVLELVHGGPAEQRQHMLVAAQSAICLGLGWTASKK